MIQVMLKNLILHLLFPLIFAWVSHHDGATASVKGIFGELSPFCSLWYLFALTSFAIRGFWRMLSELLPEHN